MFVGTIKQNDEKTRYLRQIGKAFILSENAVWNDSLSDCCVNTILNRNVYPEYGEI